MNANPALVVAFQISCSLLLDMRRQHVPFTPGVIASAGVIGSSLTSVVVRVCASYASAVHPLLSSVCVGVGAARALACICLCVFALPWASWA
jgi:hypothetical protein